MRYHRFCNHSYHWMKGELSTWSSISEGHKRMTRYSSQKYMTRKKDVWLLTCRISTYHRMRVYHHRKVDWPWGGSKSPWKTIYSQSYTSSRCQNSYLSGRHGNRIGTHHSNPIQRFWAKKMKWSKSIHQEVRYLSTSRIHSAGDRYRIWDIVLNHRGLLR